MFSYLSVFLKLVAIAAWLMLTFGPHLPNRGAHPPLCKPPKPVKRTSSGILSEKIRILASHGRGDPVGARQRWSNVHSSFLTLALKSNLPKTAERRLQKSVGGELPETLTPLIAAMEHGFHGLFVNLESMPRLLIYKRYFR